MSLLLHGFWVNERKDQPSSDLVSCCTSVTFPRLPFLTFAFGILSLCTAFVESFGSAIAVRFLLGAAEVSLSWSVIDTTEMLTNVF